MVMEQQLFSGLSPPNLSWVLAFLVTTLVISLATQDKIRPSFQPAQWHTSCVDFLLELIDCERQLGGCALAPLS